MDTCLVETGRVVLLADHSNSLYGDNEELLGKWFRRTGKRNQIFLATKFGFVKGGKPMEVDSSASYCKKACEESLKQLGVDSIDLCKSQGGRLLLRRNQCC